MLPGSGLSAKEKRARRKEQREWRKEFGEIEKRLEKERDSLNERHGFHLPSLSTVRAEIDLPSNRGIISYVKLITSTVSSEIRYDWAASPIKGSTYPISFVWDGFDVDLFESPEDLIQTKIWVTDEDTFERWVERGEPRYAIYDQMISNSFSLDPKKGCLYLNNSLWVSTHDDYLYYYIMMKFWRFLEDSIHSQKIRFSPIYKEEELAWILVISAKRWKKTIPFEVTRYCTDPLDIKPVPLLPFRERDLLMIPIPKSLAVFP